MEVQNKKFFNWTLLILLLLAAGFLRLYQIDQIPAGIYPDEAVNGTDALNALENKEYKLFYTNNNGREGLFINLITFSIRFFGNNIIGLKFWSILFGTLTVLGVFLLTREIFRSWRSGLIAAFFLCFSFWSINFSRISFRANMVPFLLTFTFFFLIRGLRTNKPVNYLVAGALFGAGFHTYIAFRVTPLIMLGFLLALIISRKDFLRKNWHGIVIFTASFLLALSPMIYNFWKHPEHLESRSSSISVFSPEVNHGNLPATLGKSLVLSLAKYNLYGDQNWRHNYPPYPILNPLVGISFLLGIIYLVSKIFHLFYLRLKHKIYDDKLAFYILLLVWFFVMLIPEFLTAEGLPHALRSIGTMPAVFVIASIPVLWLLGKSDKSNPLFRYAIYSLLTLFFCLVAITETTKYFYLWAKSPEQHGQFNESYKLMAYYLLQLPPDVNKYVLANGSGQLMEDELPVSAHVIKYLTHGKIEKLSFFKRDAVPDFQTPAYIVMMRNDESFVVLMEEKYPQMQLVKMDPRPGYPADFQVIVIP